MIDIELTNLRKAFGTGASAVAAVDDVSLRIPEGELFFLLGPSGCGKTTLLRMIAGLVAPDAGRILFGGRDVTDQPVEDRNTAMVFQNYALWPHMTVQENVEFGPRMRGVGRSERSELARANLKRVEMDALARRKPNQLSGGQQQRVAVARALAARPDCLLLDEPLSNLDARLRMHMRVELRRLVKSSGTTGVYVTHDQKEALSMADRIAVMDAGRIVQVGTPRELYEKPASRFVADFLGEANFADGQVSRAGDPATISTPLGDLLASGARGLPDGGKVLCCVRPERIEVLGGESEGSSPGELPATVEHSVYLGDIIQHHCKMSDGASWRVSSLAGAGAVHENGAKVRLRVAPENVIVISR